MCALLWVCVSAGVFLGRVTLRTVSQYHPPICFKTGFHTSLERAKKAKMNGSDPRFPTFPLPAQT